MSAFGGDEENRTPVRKRCRLSLSERSLYIDLKSLTPTDRLQIIDLDEVPIKVSEN